MTGRKPLVYYTHKAPDEAIDMLRPFCEVRGNETSRTLSKKEIVLNARGAVALCCIVPDLIVEEIVDSCPNLRVIALAGRGLDKIDVMAATRRNIWVTTVAEATEEPTADLTWALLLAAARKINVADAFMRSGRFEGWRHPPPFYTSSVFGKSLGIIGMGGLGMAIARRARGFIMPVFYYQRHHCDEKSEKELNLRYVPRDELFRKSDFICIASPLTKETAHQISTREILLMKPTAYVINPARGSEVDEEAIATALREGRIAGYATDVFEMEDRLFPDQPSCVNQYLMDHPDRTVFSPHLGTAVPEVRLEIMKLQAVHVLQALRGERPAGAANEVSPGLPIITG